ncbi:MFS transporter [Lactobacillus amylolyticus]|uniref:MFS transporter n=1 Tax=Lactobacillus amylolyticus TaxID=83683 RepID=UPI00155F5612|nr:MFS transporter [Lactobacillus amylolyticus]
MDNQQRDKIPSKVFAAIVATELMSFSGVIVETSMNIAFPTLMRQFGISTNVVSWMTSIYLLAISIIVPISTILKSSYKNKNLFLTANILFLIGLIIDALAPSFVILLLGRVILTGVVMMLVQLALFTIFAKSMSNLFISLVYIIYMAGIGMILGDVMTYALSRVGQPKTTQGNAILSTMQQFAGAVGTSITSAIVAFSQAGMGSKGPTATALGTQFAYIFLLVMAVIIFLMFLKYVRDEK